MPTTLSRPAIIAALADAYGTDPRIWRQFENASLDRAWHVALMRWS